MTITTLERLVTATTAELRGPGYGILDEARRVPAVQAEHDRIAANLQALNAIEMRPVAAVTGGAATLRIAAWNAERCKYHEASVVLLRQVDADVVLLSEMDIGMARSGNVHTVRLLADALGMGYVFGTEFVELGLGDTRERVWHAGQTNAVGLHGNAILSRLPFRDVAVIRLDEGGRWFAGAEVGQRRLGGRMAIAARVAGAAGELLAVSVHLESNSDAADRAAQVRRLLAAVEDMALGVPVVIGGDLNTNALPVGPAGAELPLEAVEEAEPLFAEMRAAGFAWETCNTRHVSLRTRPDGTPEAPFTRLDWLFCRGVAVADPATVPAVDAAGNAISDHDLVVADVRPRQG